MPQPASKPHYLHTPPARSMPPPPPPIQVRSRAASLGQASLDQLDALMQHNTEARGRQGWLAAAVALPLTSSCVYVEEVREAMSHGGDTSMPSHLSDLSVGLLGGLAHVQGRSHMCGEW